MLLPSILACSSVAAAPITAPYNWNGFYVGATGGGVFSQFNAHTATQAGSLLNSAQASTVNGVGDQTIDTTGFMTGIAGGYNWQQNHLLVGLEVDLQAFSTNSVAHTSAVPFPTPPGTQIVLTSYVNNNWLLSLRPRLGLISHNWLFYVTGGLGVTYLQSDFLFSNNIGSFESQQVSKVKPGYIVGAGVETALTNHISVKAEYLFANFSNTSASVMNHNVPAGQTFSNSVSLKSNMVRLGINYHFNDQLAGGLYPDIFPELFNTHLWETELGTRAFLSTGVVGAPQPLLGSPGMQLASRLTFSNLAAIAGETVARAEHINGLFAKAYLGAGSITTGQLNDEDFPAGGAYSNTISNAQGNLSYVTADVGYSFLKNVYGKAGAFIGYNYYAQNMNIYNCRQLAGAEVCGPATTGELNKYLVLSEDDYFNSLRIGLFTQMHLSNRLTLTSEAAYLPIVGFSGTDMHNARQLIGPEVANDGDGAMLESVLDYQFNDAWSLGLGGRYWMWNTHNGSVNFDFLGEPGTIREPARFNTERYGVFLQISYRDKKVSDLFSAALANWKGIFVGGHVGGVWGKSNWTDPFVSTPAGSLMNIAGFGNQLRETGPLGGVDLKLNWQTGQVVYGLGASVSGADIRGENTLFSGLGGVNGQAVTNYFGTLIARLGFAYDRSLFYVNGGSAWLNTTYKINANTGVLTFGSDSESKNTWGWTLGAGIDYALTDHWISSVEYDYVRIPHTTISLSTVDLGNTQPIAANQIMNVFNVGLSYKFDVFG